MNIASAHAHYDPDGTVYNMGSSFKGRPQYNIIEIPPADKTNGGNSRSTKLQSLCLVCRRDLNNVVLRTSFE